MKRIQREVVTKKDIFVSADGKEFEKEADCAAWERSYKGMLEASWCKIKKEEVSDTDYGIPYSSEDHECYVIKPKNLDELAIVNAYIQATTNNYGNYIPADSIGKLIVLNFGYDHDYCDVHVLSDHMNKLLGRVAEMEGKFSDELDTPNGTNGNRECVLRQLNTEGAEA